MERLEDGEIGGGGRDWRMERWGGERLEDGKMGGGGERLEDGKMGGGEGKGKMRVEKLKVRKLERWSKLRSKDDCGEVIKSPTPENPKPQRKTLQTLNTQKPTIKTQKNPRLPKGFFRTTKSQK